MQSIAERTKHKLLAAARAEFAEHGLAGARVDRVAAAAGINKQRIYGYFDSKDGLFDAVLAETMIEAAADKPLQAGDSPAGYADRTFDFHRNDPDLLRLLMWEALSRPVEAALSDSGRQQHYDRKIAAFTDAGLNDDEARYTLLVVLALTSYTAALPQIAALVLGHDYSDDELKSRIVDTVGRLTNL
ncbi:TetR family transcriptional regulator [Arthrobacter castelli]|uniref:TetR family transcriptional regulator n=1 Tax=Arthrobacter castelli TaxID=271431 RepID=UPI000402497E|nr:TetR family transcriptional regulator [Arthrobacter castelli]